MKSGQTFLKSGGAAFVEEDENSFLELKKIIKIIIKARRNTMLPGLT